MTVELILGDCLEVMPTLDECSVDTIITDPPGGIDFMGKQWDDLTDHEAKTERGKLVSKALSPLVELGIIENWEAGFLLFTVDWASSALRVLKPGASGLVWSIPRTSDLTQFGLRLAGFRIVDVVSHLYGSGFPKSYNISKGMKKHDVPEDVSEAWRGHGTSLKPAREDWILVYKPRDVDWVIELTPELLDEWEAIEHDHE